MPAIPAEPQVDEATFTLTAGSLCLYTAGLSESLVRVLELPDAPAKVQTLIARYSHLSRQ